MFNPFSISKITFNILNSIQKKENKSYVQDTKLNMNQLTIDVILTL